MLRLDARLELPDISVRRALVRSESRPPHSDFGWAPSSAKDVPRWLRGDDVNTIGSKSSNDFDNFLLFAAFGMTPAPAGTDSWDLSGLARAVFLLDGAVWRGNTSGSPSSPLSNPALRSRNPSKDGRGILPLGDDTRVWVGGFSSSVLPQRSMTSRDGIEIFLQATMRMAVNHCTDNWRGMPERTKPGHVGARCQVRRLM